MSNYSNFSGLQFFKPTETYNGKSAWGDPEKMDADFLKKLDFYRAVMNHPFIPHCGYETSGHVTESQHYITPCKAVDGHFKGYSVSILQAYIHAEQCGFNGIGLYPNQGRWFIHLDMRDLKPNQLKARWIRNDQGVYIPLTNKSLIQYILPLEGL